ncbi:MAG: tryptophan synthase subunit alpha [Deltaproteobacteria bacterium]|jgi:tryptophan synthase alpha chain|nr:tryptophan synthase subunit alpha [Deltaproteobacteria bacterium]
MTGISPLTQAIARQTSQGRPALIPFLTAGCPEPATFFGHLAELADNGADIIEIGLPFSDPVADGPVIAAASQEALARGVDLRWLIQGLQKNPIGVPLVLMSYANPLARHGWAQSSGPTLKARIRESLALLGSELKPLNFAGAVIPDIPLEEAAPFREGLNANALDLIPLVGPNTARERMEEYRAVAQGYVYVVSVLGTTGARDGLPPEAVATLQRAREVFALPLALGFGLKHPSQLEDFKTRPDAVIFGSALIKHLRGGGTAREFMSPWLN